MTPTNYGEAELQINVEVILYYNTLFDHIVMRLGNLQPYIHLNLQLGIDLLIKFMHYTFFQIQKFSLLNLSYLSNLPF